MYVPVSKKHFVNWVIGFTGAEKRYVVWLHHPQITVYSQPRIQRDCSGRIQKCQLSSASRVDSLAPWRLLEADGLSITPGKGCKNSRWLELISSLGPRYRYDSFISGYIHQQGWYPPGGSHLSSQYVLNTCLEPSPLLSTGGQRGLKQPSTANMSISGCAP